MFGVLSDENQVILEAYQLGILWGLQKEIKCSPNPQLTFILVKKKKSCKNLEQKITIE